jgi:hypothetical protein
MIGFAICEGELASEYIDVAILRLSGPLPALLQEELGSKVLKKIH